MNKQDIKNIEIIDKLVEKFMGYDNESLAHFKQELYTPSIDEEYLKIIGEDRRIAWEIDDGISIEENQTVSNRVYNIFADSFHTFTCHSCANNKKVMFITPENVMNNIMIVDKNEVKIKKYLSSIYTTNKEIWKRDAANHENYNENNTKEIVNNYIIKVFEKIGTIKAPSNKKLQLVLSCNFADILMGSTSENWTSCYDIEKGFYWYGVPGLIGDTNRAILYITDGSKKKFRDIEVDHMISRTWVMLTDRNKKGIVKFYPNNYYKADLVKKITKDENYISLDEGRIYPAKNKIWIPFFKNSLACTTSNDACKLIDVDEELQGLWDLGRRGGTQWIDKFSKKIIFFDGQAQNCISSLEKNNAQYADTFSVKRCCKCNKFGSLKTVNGKFYCETCVNELFFKCLKCGLYHPWEEKIEIENKLFCKDCAPEKYVCPICLQEKYSKINVDGVGICIECLRETPECKECSGHHLPANMVIIHDVDKHVKRHRCIHCVKHTKWEGFKKCPNCNEYWPVARFTNENGFCNKCNHTK